MKKIQTMKELIEFLEKRGLIGKLETDKLKTIKPYLKHVNLNKTAAKKIAKILKNGKNVIDQADNILLIIIDALKIGKNVIDQGGNGLLSVTDILEVGQNAIAQAGSGLLSVTDVLEVGQNAIDQVGNSEEVLKINGEGIKLVASKFNNISNNNFNNFISTKSFDAKTISIGIGVLVVAGASIWLGRYIYNKCQTPPDNNKSLDDNFKEAPGVHTNKINLESTNQITNINPESEQFNEVKTQALVTSSKSNTNDQTNFEKNNQIVSTSSRSFSLQQEISQQTIDNSEDERFSNVPESESLNEDNNIQLLNITNFLDTTIQLNEDNNMTTIKEAKIETFQGLISNITATLENSSIRNKIDIKNSINTIERGIKNFKNI